VELLEKLNKVLIPIKLILMGPTTFRMFPAVKILLS